MTNKSTNSEYIGSKLVGKQLCKMDNGEIVPYIACADVHTRPFDSKIFAHIGDGVVHSVRGIRQPGYTRMSFFSLITDK